MSASRVDAGGATGVRSPADDRCRTRLEEDDARGHRDVEAVRRAGTWTTVSSASSRQSAETPWRSLPTTRAPSGTPRVGSQTARSLSGVANTTVMPAPAAMRGRPRWRTRRSGRGTAFRPSRARRPDGRRRCARRTPPERSRRTSTRRGRSRRGGCPALDSARRGSAGRTSRGSVVSAVGLALDDGDQAVGRPRGGDRVKRARADLEHLGATFGERDERRIGLAEEEPRGRRPPHGSLPGPRARRSCRWPSTRKTPGSRWRERRRTALSRSFALLVMIGRRVRATGRGVGATNGDGAVRRVGPGARAHAPASGAGSGMGIGRTRTREPHDTGWPAQRQGQATELCRRLGSGCRVPPVCKGEEVEVRIDSSPTAGTGGPTRRLRRLRARRPPGRPRAGACDEGEARIRRSVEDGAARACRGGSRRPVGTSGTCGGCRFQDFDYALQLEAKQAQVRDALVRLGGLPIRPSSRSFLPARSSGTATSSSTCSPATTGSCSASTGGALGRVTDVEEACSTTDLGNAIREAVKQWALAEGLEPYDQETQTATCATSSSARGATPGRCSFCSSPPPASASTPTS